MLDRRNPSIMMILKGFHKKVGEKTRRLDDVRDDIIREGMVLQILCRKSRLSPAACAEEMYVKFGQDCTVDEMIHVYRDYKINTFEKRLEVFNKAAELAKLLEQAIKGDKQAFTSYREDFRTFLNRESVRRSQRYSRVVLAAVLYVISELAYQDDEKLVLDLSNTLSKYLLFDLENVISAAYGINERPQRQQVRSATVDYKEHERVLQKQAQLESALEQSNMLLEDLQKEFDDRLESVKIQEMSEFFGKLNSDRYGCILDELLSLRKGIDVIRKSGYDLPLEINGLLIMVKKLVQFLRDNHIDPMLRPDSVRMVKAGDVEFWNYEGTSFRDAQEEKQIRVISPGWIYSDKQVQISRPKVKEVIIDDKAQQ